MSWKINLLGTDLSSIPETYWHDVDTSALAAYVSGLSFYNSEVETVISDITAANPAVISATTLPSGLANGDMVVIEGTSDPTTYSALLDDYDYYRVSDVATATFEPQYFSPTGTSYNSVEFEALGCQPSIIDESEEITFWAGGYRRLKKGRLAFKINLYPFTTQGDFSTAFGNEVYWDLERVLYNKHIYITNFGSEFERIFSLFKKYPVEFKMPIEVEVMNFGELSAEYDKNQDRLNITLVSKEWFTFT